MKTIINAVSNHGICIILLCYGITFNLVVTIEDTDFTKSLGAEGELKLELVQIFFRHGYRNPVDPYPNDPYRNESFWPEGYAQLSKTGKQQHYKMGQYFRKRYDGFISPEYNVHEVYVQASDEDRSLMTAQVHLAGLYPPTGNPQSQWDPSIHLQLIPVHTRPILMDHIVRMSAPCPRLKQAMKEFYESPMMMKIFEDNRELLEYLTLHAGKPIKTLNDVAFLYDDLRTEAFTNYTLPEWSKKVFPGGKFYNLMAFIFKAMTYTTEMQRLRVGPLLNQLVDHFKSKVNNSMDARRKLFIYSGHDSSEGCLLNTLEVYNGIPPPYASAVILELHKHNVTGNAFIKVLFKNESDSDAYLMTIPSCNSSMCPFGSFLEFTKPKIPVDWQRECKTGFFRSMEVSVEGAIVFGSIFSIVLLGCLLVFVFIKRRRNIEKLSYPIKCY